MTELVLPDRIDDVTAQWLTGALRKGGVIADAVVREARTTVIGDGIGFMGVLARIELTYDPPQPEAPQSMIVKMPTPEKKNRGLGELAGIYEKELRFYRDVAPGLPIRTPKLYFGDMDAGPTPEERARNLESSERLPYWLMGLLGAVLIFLMGRFMRRRNVLLMEDLSALEPLDQVKGCDVEFAESVARSVGRAHAEHWEKPSLGELTWAPSLDNAKRMLFMTFKVGVDNMRSTLRAQLSERQLEGLAWLEDNYLELVSIIAKRPVTLCHGDFRLANMFHSDAQGVITLDWQGTFLGNGTYDLAYFTSGSLEDATAEDLERVLRAYHDTLIEHGVAGYSFEELRTDFGRQLTLMLATFVTLVNGLDFDNDPDMQEVTTAWIRRHAAQLALVDRDTLLRAA